MDSQLPDEVARAVLATYDSLPSNGKPRALSATQRGWTVLAAFCLIDRRSTDRPSVRCISLGTGLKVVPRTKLPKHGDVLHDSHAEVIAHRGFRLWLFDQLELGKKGEESCLRVGEDGRWTLCDGLSVALYVSTLPCGDASTYALSVSSPDSRPAFEHAILPSQGPTPTQTPSTIEAQSLGLHVQRDSATSTSVDLAPAAVVYRGRTGYSSLSTLRTKPGRLDSPPTTSHSCSDKIASWAWCGLQGSLLASFGVGHIPLEGLVVGGVDPALRERVGEEIERAIGGRIKFPQGPGGPPWGPAVDWTAPTVQFTGVEYAAHKDVVLRSVESGTNVVSCAESLSFVQGRKVEILVDGKKQGGASKRKEGEALGPKSRSRLSKLALMEMVCPGAEGSYHELKRGAGAEEYRERKDVLRESPFKGWLVHGKEWETFGVDGRLRDSQEDTKIEGN